MSLHGKIVVIKRSGGDGTEFPLTASCLFGRKPDCDIRIQLPHVSKEHCRIELNENKEVILTNLSSTNPTRVNGEVLQQSERLKHGDLITIIDRSFRFEYPPAPTPKKNRYSTASKSETPQVLHETQARDTSAKDGTNTSDVKPKDGSIEQNKPSSPFCELYQMFKQDLDSKTPKKALGTPASRLCPQNPISTRKVDGVSVISTPKKAETENVSPVTGVTPKSAQKKRKSLKGRVVEENVPVEDFIQLPPSILETPKGKRRSSKSKTPTTVEEKSTPVSQRKSRPATPEKFTASEVVEQISECPTAETLTTPTRKRSKEATPIKSLITEVEPPADAVISNQDQIVLTENSTPSTLKAELSRSPRPAGKNLQVQDVLCEQEVTTPINVKPSSANKRKSGDLETEFPTPLGKRKRVSFGGHLEPELFDKRLPPDSPLCKGATPGRRSLCVPKMKRSLLRRASAIGLIKEHEQSAPEKASPKTPSPAKKSPKASPKTPSPAKKSPKASPKTPSPAKKSPKASPKTPSPAKKSPKASPKTPSPAKKSPKAKTPSPGKEKTPKTAVKTPSPARRKSSLKDESQTTKAGKTPKTPASLPSANTTPTMQGRFSVSLVSTPSPTADQDSVLQPSVTVTPRVPLRRTTMLSTSKTTQKSAMKNALQVIRRRSGVSRASMKVVNSWADIVKFGQTKAQAVILTKKTSTRVTKTKTVVPKPTTPVRELVGHVSTGHADSPVTIVVGKAHRLKAIQPSGAAPKLVHNIALLKKNMRMDEDLSGIADIFKTPARQRKSVVNVQSALKTPLRAQSSTSMIESSVINTPEETGEMVVSPLVVSTAKRGAYNSDAVSRLLRDGQESSFTTEADDSHTTQNEILALEMSSEESREEQRPESKKTILTPKQKKPEQPECLTGVKRIMKTPRQKVQPIEDLRGKLMTTPRGPKASQEVSLDGVKELLMTPKQIAEPVEEISGKAQDDNVHSETKEIQGDAISPQCLSGNVEFKMPLYGKIVVIKRSGGDGTEFPLTASCLFGRKPDCDICVKLPEVSKEHCRIELNENNEIILTNLSSTNPTCVNGEVLQQSERLKHGDLITIIDRSFRFEYPPAPTPKKNRSSKQNTPRGPKALKKVSLDGVKTPKHIAQPVEEIPGDTQEISDAMTTEAVEELAAALAEEEQPAPFAEAVQEVEEPVAAPAEAVEEEQPAPLAVAVQEVEPVVAPAEAVEEEQPALLAEAVQEVEESVAAPAEAVEEEQPAPLAEAVQEVEEPVAAPAEAVEEEQPAPLAEAVQEVEEPVAAPAEAAHLDSEEPSVPVKGRGKKTEGIVPPPARGRSARRNETSSVEAPAETMDSVDVQEKMAADPVPVEKTKRGRKAKQASVEGVESVQENAVESESDIPSIEDQQQTSDVPVEKPRRGRKAKPSVEQVETVLENTVEAVSVTVTEKVEAQTPVVRSKRGRKPKQDSVEEVEAEVLEIPPIEIVEAKEMPAGVPVEKPRARGRRAKQESEEAKTMEKNVAEVVAVDIPTEEVEASVPFAKPKRGRKTKQESVEQVESVTVETPIEQVEAQEQTTVAPVEKPKRGGRKTKQASVEKVEPVEDHPVESLTVEVEAQVETTLASVEKPKRVGRRTKQDPECVVPPVSTETPEETSAPPTETPKRGGRRAKQQKVPEVVEVENMVVQEVHLPAQTEIDAKPEREETELLEAPVVKPGWGRKASAVVKDEVPAKRARRGAADNTKVPTAAEATVEVPTEPVKRGRRAAKSQVSADEITIAAESIPLEAEVTDTEVMTAVVRKGRGKAPKKGNAVSETTSDQANSIEGMENIDKDSKSVNWKPDLEVIHKVTPLPKQKTSRRNVTVPVTKVEEQAEWSEEQQVVKTVRGRRGRTYVEVKEETVQSTPSKRARHSTIEASAAEAMVPISKPANKRNAARNMKTEESNLSDKAVPKEPVKKTRRAARSTVAAPVEATSTTPAVPEEVPETISEATVVAATKGRGKATKGKAVSQEIDIEQSSKPRRGRAARK
uniref:Marker of proliferation Ki-67 n=1 Tax=Hucho hucho TaxID=62062 RepID=A0A4W5Q1D0_9TELE